MTDIDDKIRKIKSQNRNKKEIEMTWTAEEFDELNNLIESWNFDPIKEEGKFMGVIHKKIKK